MKKFFFFMAAICLSFILVAQSPEKMSYQAVVRNDNNQLLVNQNVKMRISILKSSVTGTAEYIETQLVTTNSNGLLSIQIGEGSIVSGSFSDIDWASNIYFLKTEIDPNGGSNYSIISTQQLLSVPYALFAKTAASLTEEIVETDPFYTAWDKSTGITITESQISDLKNYLINEIDPMFSNWDKTTGIVITENQISDLQSYITSELDPIYAASLAAGITAEDIASWNAKLSAETQTLAAVALLGNSVYTQIKDMVDPTDAQDAVTKGYHDSDFDLLEERLAALENQLFIDTPIVITESATQITATSASCHGTVVDTGHQLVISRGICWSTLPQPTVEDSVFLSGFGPGQFSCNLTGLSPYTIYYYKSFAINANTVAYGEEMSFITLLNPGIIYGNGVTDVDGNTYVSVLMDSIEVMAENLKTTKYKDGSNIPLVVDETAWTETTLPAYSWYNHDISFKEVYGALYNWYVVQTENLCPIGWHVINNAEWTAIINMCGGLEIAGYHLKANSSLWNNNNNGIGAGGDTYGFSAYPGGWRRHIGTFQLMNENGRWWSADLSNATQAYRYTMNCCGNSRISQTSASFNYGYSIRCVKDRTNN
ncbi:MAG: fibrobacter succinogenes major paralogous domain-containing protein [Bacteroidales bacterium]|nr:fibrobacter succinogenes major paralogous domain-containing protein [Bacteroidales bacterium]